MREKKMVATIMDTPSGVKESALDMAREEAENAAGVYTYAIIALEAIADVDQAIPGMIEKLYELADDAAYEAAHGELEDRGYSAEYLATMSVRVRVI
jgi:hypothetical protein